MKEKVKKSEIQEKIEKKLMLKKIVKSHNRLYLGGCGSSMETGTCSVRGGAS